MPDAQGHRKFERLATLRVVVRQVLLEARDEPWNRGLVGHLERKHREFVAAKPGDHISRAIRLTQDARRGDQRPVPGGVAVLVVDVFQLVDISEDERDTALVTLGEREVALCENQESAAVVQPGEFAGTLSAAEPAVRVRNRRG